MTGLLAVLISFSLYVLTHWAICRWLRWRPHSKVINILWFGFLPVYLLIFFALKDHCPALAVNLSHVDGVINLLNGLFINGMLLIGYTDFFFGIERGLSLRVMIEIFRSPRQRMTMAEIQNVYTYDYILEKRLGQIVKMDCGVKEGDAIRLTPKGSRVVAMTRLIRKIFNIEQVM
jgi:hypothetical protein